MYIPWDVLIRIPWNIHIVSCGLFGCKCGTFIHARHASHTQIYLADLQLVGLEDITMIQVLAPVTRKLNYHTLLN